MHTCPVWVGYLLASRLRRWVHDPEAILRPYVEPGMVVLDVGSAMGYFSLPMARMVGPEGRVVCVDVQAKMLEKLRGRAVKAGVGERIETRLATDGSLGIDDLRETADFALLFMMVHEARDAAGLFRDVAAALRPGGKVLMAEPKGHVRREDFEAQVAEAERHGLGVVGEPGVWGSHAAVLRKG